MRYCHVPWFDPMPSETSLLCFPLDSRVSSSLCAFPLTQESAVPWRFWFSDGNLSCFMLVNICHYFLFFFFQIFQWDLGREEVNM